MEVARVVFGVAITLGALETTTERPLAHEPRTSPATN
jgi:hypothetical protein